MKKVISTSHKRSWIIYYSQCKFFAVAIKDLDEALSETERTNHYDMLLHTLKTDMEITYPEFLTLVKS